MPVINKMTGEKPTTVNLGNQIAFERWLQGKILASQENPIYDPDDPNQVKDLTELLSKTSPKPYTTALFRILYDKAEMIVDEKWMLDQLGKQAFPKNITPNGIYELAMACESALVWKAVEQLTGERIYDSKLIDYYNNKQKLNSCC